MRRLAGLVAAACLGGAALAACSSATTPSATTSSTTSSPASSTTPTTSATTTTAGSTVCATSALSASIYGSAAAAGTVETTVALRSTASAPCQLGGYPGLAMLNAAGGALTTTVVRGGSYTFTSLVSSTVTLSDGQTAYFNMGYSDVPTGSQTSCPSSTSLEITPPNDTSFLTIAAQLGPCNNGTMTVSPVFLASGGDAQTMAPAG
jgi:hypothetical protein